ncbi:MAG TPA: hypothetical protein VJ828_13000, partial [Lacipirellulaceae bacterium]|nr:hypothetical protein [Lacipirellulaceae bacterium]
MAEKGLVNMGTLHYNAATPALSAASFFEKRLRSLQLTLPSCATGARRPAPLHRVSELLQVRNTHT